MEKITMPKGYYINQIIEKFCENDKRVDYNTEIYNRNKAVDGKLTLNHLEYIEYYVRMLKPKSFLELGVQYGECSERILPLIQGNYHGVDIKGNVNVDILSKKYNNFKFHETTTDNYFKNLDKDVKFEMIFIDACHTHEATYNDFLNAKEHIKDDGIIFFHDTYPNSLKWTSNSLCGDGYKTSEDIRLKHNGEFEIFTLPINPGISIARKCPKNHLMWIK